MANVKDSLDKIMQIEGALGACVVDSSSGMMLGAIGGGAGLNIEVAAAGNTEVVRAKRKTMKSLGLNDSIEDILITLGKQYHIIRLSTRTTRCSSTRARQGRANLAMARIQIADIEKQMQIA